MLEYIENGKVIAKGVGIVNTVLSYLSEHLGYDLMGISGDYEWADYPKNPNYEVCELGLIRNKKTGRYIASLKYKYVKGDKSTWRLKVTIPFVGTVTVAQVVADTFLDKPDDKIDYVIGHKNDIPIDNRAENLEYITPEQNKTIDWVMKEVGLRGLTVSYVDYVYAEIKKTWEDVYGEQFGLFGELGDEVAEEVTESMGIYKRTVQDIYDYKVNGTGVLARLSVVGDKFIL